MDISKYPPSGQLKKVSEIVRLLFANGAVGVTPTEIARGAKVSASYVTQQLAQLAHVGWAEEVGESGRWRPSVRFSQMAVAQATAIERERTSLEDFSQRISRHHK